ncbi:MAG: class I SAM-dependent methyltransferase [Endozoicomonadaceae bacterium]|nr:class I SAM-dependent methyltransferase [Endozoicomonadaceae bacterium]
MDCQTKQRISLSEKLKLWPLSILVSVREWRFALQALPFIWHRTFLRSEWWRCLLFFQRSAWRLSVDYYLDKNAPDIHCFGETPLITLIRICRRVGIDANDEFLEVGAATGRNCFWLSSVVGCRAVGLEQIPDFVHRAECVASWSQCADQVRFVCGDMGEMLPGHPSVVYLYGSNLENELIQRFATLCSELSVGVMVITVSYPLTDYLQESFEVVDAFPVAFTWGVTTVYVQKVIRYD